MGSKRSHSFFLGCRRKKRQSRRRVGPPGELTWSNWMGNDRRNAALGGKTSQQVRRLISAWPFSGLFSSWCLLCLFPVTRLRRSHSNEASFVPSTHQCNPTTSITICYYENGSTDQAQPARCAPSRNKSIFCWCSFLQKQKDLEPPPVASVAGKQWKSCSPQGPGEAATRPASVCAAL